MSFEGQIKEWVSTDNLIKLHLEKLRELRTKRNDITDFLVSYAADKNLDNAVVQISDGRLKFQQTKITNPLTFKFVQECLLECISNDEHVKQIIQYIKEKRSVRVVADIKRFYKKM